MKRRGIMVSLLVLGIALQAGAQYDYSAAAPPPAPTGQILAGTQLDQLLGPIALYPDPLIAQILPAATQPSQIAVAANYLASGGDPNAIDQQPWDSSVKAVAHVPQVLQMLDGNLEWTSELGEAFMNQPTDVMNSVQRLRAAAQQYGNLQNNPQETVVSDEGQIEILPANPDMCYVPTYDPGVVYYQAAPWAISFGVGFGIGLWFNHDFDWHDHHIVYWNHDHPRPHDWWHERPDVRRRDFASHPVWRPQDHRRDPRQSFSPVNRGDRGYAPRPTRSEPPHDNRPGHVEQPPHQPQRPVTPPHAEPRPNPPSHVEPPRAPNPPAHVEPPHAPAPPTHVELPHPIQTPRAPVENHVAPAPSRPSAFSGVQSAPEARAASSRGSESRQISHPSPPASHPPSSGGGGGGRKK